MDNVTRRDFLNLLKGTGAVIGVGAVAVPVVSYFYPPKLEEMPSEPVLVCTEEELPSANPKRSNSDVILPSLFIWIPV